ncbi:MAG: type II toxin-antitoxin system VapC family toxin [Bacteriovoracia bacterium]
MKILFDTSSWIHHFHKRDNSLTEALENDLLVIHEMVLGELVVGRLPPAVFKDLLKLERLPQSDWMEIVDFTYVQKLYGIGLSWVDICLLYSSLVHEVELVTRDKTLLQIYQKLSK